MKISLGNTFDEKSRELVITPKTPSLGMQRLRSSRSCKVSIKLPTVENEKVTENEVQKPKFPLRANSVIRVQKRKILSVTPNLLQIQVSDKICEKSGENRCGSRKGGFRSVKCAYDKYLSDSVGAILGSHVTNFALLPDPHIMEHKRALMRLRKLKSIPVKSGKENLSIC